MHIDTFVFRMIHLGEVDVMKCFQSYLKSAAYLCKVASKNYSGLPLVVNTMGFSSGKLLRPSGRYKEITLNFFRSRLSIGIEAYQDYKT